MMASKILLMVRMIMRKVPLTFLVMIGWMNLVRGEMIPKTLALAI